MNLARRLTLLDDGLWRLLGSVQRFAAANKGLMTYLVIIAVVAFGYDLASFSLRTDAELHASIPGAKLLWIEQGRWAMYFLNAGLMPDAVMPFIPVLVGLLGLACGVLGFVLSLSERRTSSDYLAAPLVIGCPLLAFGFYFTTLNYGLGIAIAAVGLGQYALTRWRPVAAALAIACFAIAIGIYQATLLLIPVMFGFYLVAQIIVVPRLDAGLLLRRVGVFCAIVLAACGLYESIKLATLHVYGVPYAREYLHGYLTFGADPEYWDATIRKTINTAKAYYTGGEDYYLYKLGIVAVLFWTVAGLTVVRLLVAPQSPMVKAIGGVALAAGLCAPLLMHLLNGGYMPPRTVLGVPFVLGGLVFCTTISGNRTVNFALAALVVMCFFKFVVTNNRYALANELAWKADQDLSLLILQRVHTQWQKLPDRGPHPVVLVGMLEARESPLHVHRELIGSSFYHVNGGSVGRVLSLWQSMRHFDFRNASNEEAIAVASRSIVMPIWPAEGSVDVVDGVIVVKIGDFTTAQILALCRASPTSDFCERDAQRLLSHAGAASGKAAVYQGRWVSAPPGSEEGWGLELAHQGDTVFVSWFTYDIEGRNWWLVMSAQRQKSNVYAGTLMETHGPPIVAPAFSSADVVWTPVGNGRLTFSDANTATFDYTVKGVRQSKPITRAVLGASALCPSGEIANTLNPNYQGLWWAAPAGAETGWGLSLNQHGDMILGTWFTYDPNGAPLWLSLTARKTKAGVYSADVHRKGGARFDAFDPAAVRSTKVGTATLDFADASNAALTFSLEGIGPATLARTQPITRSIVGLWGSPCQFAPAVGVRQGPVAESTPKKAWR